MPSFWCSLPRFSAPFIQVYETFDMAAPPESERSCTRRVLSCHWRDPPEAPVGMLGYPGIATNFTSWPGKNSRSPINIAKLIKIDQIPCKPLDISWFEKPKNGKDWSITRRGPLHAAPPVGGRSWGTYCPRQGNSTNGCWILQKIHHLCLVNPLFIWAYYSPYLPSRHQMCFGRFSQT